MLPILNHLIVRNEIIERPVEILYIINYRVVIKVSAVKVLCENGKEYIYIRHNGISFFFGFTFLSLVRES